MKYLITCIGYAAALAALWIGNSPAQQGVKPKKLKATLTNVNGSLSVSVPRVFQSGILGEYFNEEDPGNANSVVARRIEPSIDYSWPNGVPDGTNVNPDGTYSCRWSGFVLLDAAGNWTFTTTSDDGVRLWLDGSLLIQDWTVHSPRESSVTRSLAAGWHEIRMELFNRWSQWGVQATARLEFQGPGQSRAVIPEDKLCLDPTATASPVFQYDAATGRRYRISVVRGMRQVQ